MKLELSQSVKAKLKLYSPALSFLGVAFFFYIFPWFAAFLMILACVTLGVVYGWVIYRVNDFKRRGMDYDWANDFRDPSEPKFRTITVVILRRPEVLKNFF